MRKVLRTGAPCFPPPGNDITTVPVLQTLLASGVGGGLGGGVERTSGSPVDFDSKTCPHLHVHVFPGARPSPSRVTVTAAWDNGAAPLPEPALARSPQPALPVTTRAIIYLRDLSGNSASPSLSLLSTCHPGISRCAQRGSR